MRAVFLLFLVVTVGCGGNGQDGCVELLGDGDLAGVGVGPPQVLIESRIVLVDRTSFKDLGLSFGLTAAIQTDNGGTFGAVSRQGSDVVADGQTLGGPAGVPYLVPNNFGGLLSIVNVNFLSPFSGQPTKVFMSPLEALCFTIDQLFAMQIQNFAGGANQAPLQPFDPGLDGTILYEKLDSTALASLIAQIESDTRNSILNAPLITTFDRQRTVIVLQDVQPTVNDLTPPFQTAVQAVTTSPLGMFGGVAIDVVPTIVNDMVQLDVRPGTQVISFFRSIPANVNGQPADVEIPVIAPSIVKTTVTVADGQTLVLGDLQRAGQSDTESGIPVLGELPIVGSLFRNHSNDQQNLIIMITPRIILGE